MISDRPMSPYFVSHEPNTNYTHFWRCKSQAQTAYLEYKKIVFTFCQIRARTQECDHVLSLWVNVQTVHLHQPQVIIVVNVINLMIIFQFLWQSVANTETMDQLWRALCSLIFRQSEENKEVTACQPYQ